MRVKFGLVLLATAVAGCGHKPYDLPARGADPVNVPVVTSSTFVFDAAAPGGYLAPAEAARLDAWFRGLGLGYGDTIYVDGAYADTLRYQIAQIAGNYGLLVAPGAPVTAGVVPPEMVRVVVTRTVASVPNCPNWDRPSQPNYNNQTLPNFGCAVNSNLAAMVANPQDLVHGREGSAAVDAATAAKAIEVYRTTAPTGTQGLTDISTKKDDQ